MTDTIRVISNDLLDEFSDVSAKEKELMKAWNKFVESDVVVPDYELPARMLEFAAAFKGGAGGKRGRDGEEDGGDGEGREIKRGKVIGREIRNEIVKHGIGLWENGLIPGECVLDAIDIVDGRR